MVSDKFQYILVLEYENAGRQFDLPEQEWWKHRQTIKWK